MKTVFVDTNFWLIIYLYKIDIFSELERVLLERFNLVVSQGVISELKKIAEKSQGKEGTAARIALKLIEKEAVSIIEDKNEVDNLVVDLAGKDNNFILCTNDRELRKKVKRKGRGIVVMQEKSHLGFL